MKNQCLQDEGVDSSSTVREHLCEILKVPHKSHTNALIQVVGFHFISRLAIKRGLELMIGTLGSIFDKEEIGVRTPQLAISNPKVFFKKDLV